MPFNTALSGLRAAQGDLQITGNNIANASTVGFKQSRAEFADVYAASALGGGANAIGSGVVLQNVAQQFSQGTINFTENSLDLAISGEGFFQMDAAGTTVYTRAGQFGLDNDGNIVNSSGAILQGQVSVSGEEPSGDTQALQLSTDSINPARTTAVDQRFNLDSTEDVRAEYTTEGYLSLANSDNISVAQIGTAVALDSDNGYDRTTFNLLGANGASTEYDIPSIAGGSTSASSLASELNDINGITAVASTSMVLRLADYTGVVDTNLDLDGTDIGADSLAGVVNNINTELGSQGYTALEVIDAAATVVGNQVQQSGDLAVGDILITLSSGNDMTLTPEIAVDVAGVTENAAGVLQQIDGAAATAVDGTANEIAIVGGNIAITLDDTIAPTGGITLAATNTGNLFPATFSQTFGVPTNTFDPSDTGTYNHVTSMTVYDSLGAAHAMTQYFVKESTLSETIDDNASNPWSLYIQIDGEDVGPIVNDANTPARYILQFDSDGTLAEASQEVEVDSWTPSGSSADVAGPAVGANPLVADPPDSSNFRIDLTGTTVFGGSFDVSSISQNGFATGKLSSIQISDEGTIFARFTNGEAETIGRVQLAKFDNPQGLANVGNSSWSETFESGTPTIATAGTSSLGLITAGAVEESNADLSSELVNLILAQRNFQANAKTIETANAVTQTIINLR